MLTITGTFTFIWFVLKTIQKWNVPFKGLVLFFPADMRA